MTTVAIVPMRHSSERVPGKNYRPLAGVPLYHYVIKTLLAVESIDLVVVDTDSPIITEDAATEFPEVRVLQRPEHLRDGEIPMNEVLLNSLAQLDADLVIQTHSTNPFLSPDTVSRALETFEQSRPKFDSMFSVTELHARLWTADTAPLNHDLSVLQRTQDLEPLYIENSSFFIFLPEILRERKNRIGYSPLMFPMEPLEAVDIDTEGDWDLANAIAASRVAR